MAFDELGGPPDLSRELEAADDIIRQLERRVEEACKQRDAWHKACAVLYGECREGGSRGRPMDCIPTRAWYMIVELIAAAEDTERE